MSHAAALETDSPIRALIADDEPLGRDTVRMALEAEPDIEIVGECGSGREAARLIAQLEPDVVFLDVQMPDGDAFHVIETFDTTRPMPAIVFVTAYDEHAVRAFDAHAVDYLVKPFDSTRFRRSLERVRAQLRTRHAMDVEARLAALLRTVRGPTTSDASDAMDPSATFLARRLTRIAVRHDDRVVFVPVGEVDSFEASGNYVIVRAKGRAHRIRAKLGELAAQLDPVRFKRIHRSTIVNVEHVREVQPWFGGDYVALLIDGRSLRVSRTYAAELLKTLQ